MTWRIDAPPPGAADLYEVVNGRLVNPPDKCIYECFIANELNAAIHRHYALADLPGLCLIECLFQLRTEPYTWRRPDLAFLSYERWPRRRAVPQVEALPAVPDLAVETVDPNIPAVEIVERLDDYFAAGVRQAWVIYPRHRRVFIHDGPKRITVLDDGDTLDGGAILPGLRLTLAELFAVPVESGE